MAKFSSFYGKLPKDCIETLDSLLLKMKRLNRRNAGKHVIRTEEIVPLPDDEYVRLWGYIRHCCKLVATWKNVRSAICVVAEKSGRSFDDVHDECVDSMTIHVYTYAWRKYRHSEDCNYVFSTATYGYLAWIDEQNRFNAGIVAEMERVAVENGSGRKVSNANAC